MPSTESRPASRSSLLASARQSRGFTQGELAQQVGVSRQFLNQVESGSVLPNVAVALRLAALLGETVESLFGATSAESSPAPIITVADPTLSPGARLRLGWLDGRWIAHAADTPRTVGAGFNRADALLETGSRARLLVPITAAKKNLLIAGCDPALGLLSRVPPNSSGAGTLHWIDCGSGTALELLKAGLVHVAGIHYSGTEGSGNLAALDRVDPSGSWALFRFSRWAQGWLLRPGAHPVPALPKALSTGRLRLANREEGSAARAWLEERLRSTRTPARRITGYDQPGFSATEAARAVANGAADVTIGPQSLALSLGLQFVPGEEVDFDLVIPRTLLKSPLGNALLTRLLDPTYQETVATLPGYSVVEMEVMRRRR